MFPYLILVKVVIFTIVVHNGATNSQLSYSKELYQIDFVMTTVQCMVV